ncbi:MAG: hypothetical protein LUQ31_00160 [Methanoregula sp.]|nr:hypothetical protein [Methanoregula sp.]
MKSTLTSGMILGTFLLIALVTIVPVSALSADNASVNTTAASATATVSQPYVSATVSSITPTIGTPVTISGIAHGGNLTPGVQIWVFAGNYVNVTTTAVNPDGTYSKTYSTEDLPAAIYYVFVESPGNDGSFDLAVTNVNGYASQVINPKTGAFVFNFTGTGSVQDKAAMEELSSTLNQAGFDDPYTKLSFTLVAPTGSVNATSNPTAAATTAKSPLPIAVSVLGIGLAGLAVALVRRQ